MNILIATVVLIKALIPRPSRRARNDIRHRLFTGVLHKPLTYAKLVGVVSVSGQWLALVASC